MAVATEHQQQDASKSVLDTLRSHVTIREYLDKPIEKELLKELLNAARRSPTSSNMQAYSMVVVQDQETKDRLSELAGNQKHIRTCGAFVAICADISRLDTAAKMHDQHLARNLENMLVSSVDAALVGMSLNLAAESVGLGACMIGGMRNHPKEAAELLNLPDGSYIVYGMTLGWPDWDRVRQQKPRLPEDSVIHWERYDSSQTQDQLSTYDKALKTHYEKQGRNLDDAAWTGVIGKKFGHPRREHLRSELEELGFSFD